MSSTRAYLDPVSGDTFVVTATKVLHFGPESEWTISDRPSRLPNYWILLQPEGGRSTYCDCAEWLMNHRCGHVLGHAPKCDREPDHVGPCARLIHDGEKPKAAGKVTFDVSLGKVLIDGKEFPWLVKDDPTFKWGEGVSTTVTFEVFADVIEVVQ